MVWGMCLYKALMVFRPSPRVSEGRQTRAFRLSLTRAVYKATHGRLTIPIELRKMYLYHSHNPDDLPIWAAPELPMIHVGS